jgi:hypothetical protein
LASRARLVHGRRPVPRIRLALARGCAPCQRRRGPRDRGRPDMAHRVPGSAGRPRRGEGRARAIRCDLDRGGRLPAGGPRGRPSRVLRHRRRRRAARRVRRNGDERRPTTAERRPRRTDHGPLGRSQRRRCPGRPRNQQGRQQRRDRGGTVRGAIARTRPAGDRGGVPRPGGRVQHVQTGTASHLGRARTTRSATCVIRDNAIVTTGAGGGNVILGGAELQSGDGRLVVSSSTTERKAWAARCTSPAPVHP